MVKKFCLSLITLYRKYISPCFPPSCRFMPTCSEYTFEAVSRYGVLKGVFLGTKRILRCNPFCKGGYDPVPDAGKR